MWLLQFESALNIWASPNKSYHGSFHQLGYQINSKHPLCSVYYSYLILTTFFLCSTDLRKSPHFLISIFCNILPQNRLCWIFLNWVCEGCWEKSVDVSATKYFAVEFNLCHWRSILANIRMCGGNWRIYGTYLGLIGLSFWGKFATQKKRDLSGFSL